MRERAIPLLLVVALAACSEPQIPVEISFVATFGEQVIQCEPEPSDASLSDLRLYVSNVELMESTSGESVPLRLRPDPGWQSADVTLIDLEDGQGTCANGTPSVNAILTGDAPARDFDGIRLEIGVPFELNHANPLTAEAPLDDAAMHWHWRSGYKFLRAGLDSNDDGFWLHLGSAGCEGTVQNIRSCKFPNRVTVELSDFDPGRDHVAIDLRALTEATDLLDGSATDCSSSPADSACVAPFRALGIDHASGDVKGSQSVFRAMAL